MASQQDQDDFDTLENLFVVFAQTFFARLSAEAANQQAPYQYPTPEQWDHYEHTCLEMEEANECVRKHWEAGLLRLSPFAPMPAEVAFPITSPTFEQSQYGLLGDLMSPIRSVLKQSGTFQPTKEQILEHYRLSRSQWTATDVRCDVIFPLLYLESDVEQEQKISPQLHFAPFTFDEKKALWQEHLPKINEELFSFTLVPIPDLRSLLWVNFKLTGSYSQKRVETLVERSYEQLDIVKEMGNVLTALRLLKRGTVGILGLLEERQRASVWEHTFANVLLDGYPTPHWSTLYTLHKTDLPEVTTIFDALQRLAVVPPRGRSNVQSHGELAVALRRFNQAYGRQLGEDQIIDLTIALESSLLAKERDELNYRLSLRGAALLANAEPRWEPYKSQILLKTMYEVRSNIVHNGQELSDRSIIKKLEHIGIPPQEFPQQCEDAVRDILRAYVLRLAKGGSVEQVNQELDRYIVGSLMPSAEADT